MNNESVKNNSLIQKLSKGFSKLSRPEREQRLIQMGVLNVEDIAILNHESALSSSSADQFIENAVGSFPLPLGFALNFVIDGQDYIIPMAVEETSVIAGASKTAKWISEKGEITTQNLSQLGIGQIQFPKVKHFEVFKKKIEEAKKKLIHLANSDPAKGMVRLGGGVRDIVIRPIPRENNEMMVVIHVLVDTCDAMGANLINQVCEFLKPTLEELTQEKVGLCILSNLADSRITEARVILRNIDLEIGKAIEEASVFAQLDSYRAATNNKGVMNGIDSVLIATGNDWRAVEAGVHAYAALSGHYTSITQWAMKGPDLHGVMKAPILLGIVEG